jgi:2-polyprenyl-6-hydroxyphenyl methylase/3-demethylubiquinone-9 3-methyltransferase
MQKEINKTVYSSLGDKWYTANNDPIALLRAESKLRNPYIIELIQKQFGATANILDLGAGAGFLTLPLLDQGFSVTALDLAPEALAQVTKRYKGINLKTQCVDVEKYGIPKNQKFDVVCAMDILEHVKEPKNLVSEVSQVLNPGGLFICYTFNRTWLSYVLAIKALEWFLPETPKNLHLYSLFIKPEELKSYASNANLIHEETKGVKPKINLEAISSIGIKGVVPEKFEFTWTKSQMVGYFSVFKKDSSE